MEQLTEFIRLLTGTFTNKEQKDRLCKKGITDFPLARHVNTVCNNKILHLPKDFPGIFIVEESYYTIGENTRTSPHLFLFTEEKNGVLLTSYEIPSCCDKTVFSYETMEPAEYTDLKASEKFTPAFYTLKDGAWEGGSVSMFSPVLKFTLWERFSREQLEVCETMEVNGKKTFGYEEPIIYKRTAE